MRYLACLVSVLISALALGSEVDQSLSKAYIPAGFDSNDSVQIVVAGKFPHTCHQMGAIFTSLDRGRKVLEVQVSAYEHEGRCLPVEVPFFQVVHVGLVGMAGSFRVVDRTTKKSLGVLSLKEAGEGGGPDDETYAPLLDAYFLPQPGGKKLAVLSGIFSDTCLRLKDVEVRYHPDVVVVMPKLDRRGTSCAPASRPFHKKVELEPELKGTFLLHVRALGGQAFNKMVVLPD